MLFSVKQVNVIQFVNMVLELLQNVHQFYQLTMHTSHIMPLLLWLHNLFILYLHLLLYLDLVTKNCRAIHILFVSPPYHQLMLVSAKILILIVDQLDFKIFILNPMARSIILPPPSTQMHVVLRKEIDTIFVDLSSSHQDKSLI